MAPRSPDEYQISVSTSVRRRLYDLHERAARKGKGRALAELFRKIIPLLRTNPEASGQYVSDLPEMGLTRYAIAEPPLKIIYCVDSDRRMVYLQTFQPTPPDAF